MRSIRLVSPVFIFCGTLFVAGVALQDGTVLAHNNLNRTTVTVPPKMGGSLSPYQNSTVNRNKLNSEMKSTEAAQEKTRNSRQQQKTQFQNSDQKENQLMEMLSDVVKDSNNSRNIGAGSRSGL